MSIGVMCSLPNDDCLMAFVGRINFIHRKKSIAERNKRVILCNSISAANLTKAPAKPKLGLPIAVAYLEI